MQFKTLKKLTEKLDDFLRFQDFQQNRTVGGPLDGLLGIGRYSTPVLVLPSLVCALLVLASPAPSRMASAIVVFFASGAILAGWMRLSYEKKWPLISDLFVQVVVVSLTGFIVWQLGPNQFRDSGLYRHLLIPVAAALCIALLAASVLVGVMFRKLRTVSMYGRYLKVTELFASRGPAPDVTPGTILTSLLTALFRAPLALLTLPAIAALVSPPIWLFPLTGTVFAICFLGLFIAGLNERFGTMWSLLQSVFFQGGALLVSLLVILLAALRLAGVLYVTTVLDTAAWWSIGVLLVATYTLSWWYDYWSHRLLTDQILGMIAPAGLGTAQIPYSINPANVATAVPDQGRVLQVQGASRLVAINKVGNDTFFQSHTAPDLIEILAITGAPGGKAVPTPIQVTGRMFNFHTVAALVFVALVSVPAWMISKGVQQAEARLDQNGGSGVSLTELLHAASQNGDPVIAIAASGGGTRAAVYTASILEGIQNLGKGKDVILGSGVSGGSASLAYFAGHRPELVEQKESSAWDRYFATMSMPFIRDVIDRSTEWRMVGSGRLGMLLDESFQRRWKLPEERSRLSQVRDMGLILNTSLAGSFQWPIKIPPPDGRLEDAEPRYRNLTKSTLAGGRLLLTNLIFPPDMTRKALEPGVTEDLPVVLRRPDLCLTTAAALSANFPPVFSNAAIDVDNKKRYWVTDGGAEDNRGMEMLLFALRSSLADQNSDTLPNLFIIVADASGFSDRYTQDRGLGSLSGAGTHFASQLDAELVESIRQKYGSHGDRFHFSYVRMPDLIRQSDSFGTNWMLQTRIKVDTGSAKITLAGEEMVKVLRALHTPTMASKLTDNGCKILEASLQDVGHRQGWIDLVTGLGGTDTIPSCRHKE
jgi:hypothetical protein